MDNETKRYLDSCVVGETEMSLHSAIEDLDSRVTDLETSAQDVQE